MPYPPKITNEKKSDHNFIYPSDGQHKNVAVKIVNSKVNALSMEISLIFNCLFQIFRLSRKPFRDVTLYCETAVSIELIDIISLVLKYVNVYHLILNIFLDITSKNICLYYFFFLKKDIWLVWIGKNPGIRWRNSLNISPIWLVILSEARK